MIYRIILQRSLGLYTAGAADPMDKYIFRLSVSFALVGTGHVECRLRNCRASKQKKKREDGKHEKSRAFGHRRRKRQKQRRKLDDIQSVSMATGEVRRKNNFRQLGAAGGP